MKKPFTSISSRSFSLVFLFLSFLAGIPRVDAAVVTFSSPTPKVGTLYLFVVEVLKIVIKIGVPVVAIMLIWSGYLFVSAQGDPTQLKKAKDSFVWGVVGAAILLCAVLIATIIKNTIGNLGG
jgi:hypothetical protein